MYFSSFVVCLSVCLSVCPQQTVCVCVMLSYRNHPACYSVGRRQSRRRSTQLRVSAYEAVEILMRLWRREFSMGLGTHNTQTHTTHQHTHTTHQHTHTRNTHTQHTHRHTNTHNTPTHTHQHTHTHVTTKGIFLSWFWRQRKGVYFISTHSHRPQAACCWPVTTETGVQSQFSPCGICGERSGFGTGFSPSTSVLPPILRNCSHLYPRRYTILATGSVVKQHSYFDVFLTVHHSIHFFKLPT